MATPSLSAEHGEYVLPAELEIVVEKGGCARRQRDRLGERDPRAAAGIAPDERQRSRLVQAMDAQHEHGQGPFGLVAPALVDLLRAQDVLGDQRIEGATIRDGAGVGREGGAREAYRLADLVGLSGGGAIRSR